MSLFKNTTAYGRGRVNDAPTSPYERAKREWDRRLGTARAQAFHWRLIALTSVLGTISLGASLAYVSARKDVRTYVVEVDRIGHPSRITLIDDQYNPDSAQIGHFVAQLVRLVRARPLDPVVVRENWKQAYAHLAGDAVHAMNAYAASDPPLSSADGRPATRVVELSNVLQKSRDTYQVRWMETDYVGGVPQEPQHRTGLFQTETKPPRDEADVFRNPLGIYVVSFSWSKEFTGPVASDVAAAVKPSPATQQELAHEPYED